MSSNHIECVEVVAGSRDEAVTLATEYVQRLFACDPRARAAGDLLSVEWVGVRLPARITDSKVIHVVWVKFGPPLAA